MRRVVLLLAIPAFVAPAALRAQDSLRVEIRESQLRLEQIRQERPLPRVLRTDNGPEFLGEAFVSWAREHGMTLRYTQPGKPNQNAYIERFNRTYREEVLDCHLFVTLDDVREATWKFLIDYNEHRSHDALDEMTPIEYRNHHAGISIFGMSA